MKARLPVLVPMLLLAGCAAVGPDFRKPDEPAASAFRNAPPSASDGRAAQVIEDWWTVYADQGLDTLERQALAGNPGLAAVAARVREARIRLGIAKADTLPSASLAASARLAGEGAEKTLPLPGNPIHYRDEGDYYRLAADATYEIDLWGRVRRSIESAQAQYAASLMDERGARLSLGADIALNYFSLRALEAELQVLERTIGQRRESVEVMRARNLAGYTTELDVQRAAADQASVEAELAEVSRRRELLANALAVLTGVPPSQLTLPAEGAFPPAPPRISPGLPAEVLRRRPDLAAAEELLHARMAEIGVAEAARYPTIRITGLGGFESADLGNLLERPSQFWQLGPTLSMPLFDGGRAKSNAQAAVERAESARADHRQKTLNALREVEDALVDLRQQAAQAEALGRASSASQTALELARTRYDKGLTNYLEVLDTQRTLLQLERTRTQVAGARLASSVRLIRALGGAW